MIDPIELIPECPDCAAPIGHAHRPGCDVAICPHTGERQFHHAIDTTADAATGNPTQPHTCGEDLWTGEYPGAAEAREFGWWCRAANPEDLPLIGWIPCPADHPDAVLDLHRVAAHAIWDAAARRWRPAEKVAGRG